MRVLPGKDNPSLPEQNRDPNQAADRPNPRGVRDHGRGRLDRDPVVRGNAGLSGAARGAMVHRRGHRSEEHTSELQSLMRISYAVFCLKKTINRTNTVIRQRTML